MIDAILLCGGKSERFSCDKSKLLAKIGGVEVAKKAYLNLLSCNEIDKIYVVIPKNDEKIKELFSDFPSVLFVFGGDSRFMSVFHAIKELSCQNATARPDIVLICDGARPFTSLEVLNSAIHSAKKFGSGIAAIKSTDTLARVENGVLTSSIDREMTVKIQTPQAFDFEDILKAYTMAFEKYGEKAFYTDDSQVYSEFIKHPHLSLGEEKNIKITFRDDLLQEILVGVGYDIHTLTEGRKLILCGVEIPFSLGLLGHSDADAPVHALMDGILSALGEKDIGHLFPPDDDSFLGANSLELLASVLEISTKKGYAVKNVSISIIAEKPKLSPYIDEMKSTLAKALGISSEFVGISVTTNEKVGLIGEGLAIASFASCQLVKI